MPLFFFDVFDGVDDRDEDGVECADLSDARRQALKSAGAMLAMKAVSWTPEHWRMEVRDASGTVVAALDFKAT